MKARFKFPTIVCIAAFALASCNETPPPTQVKAKETKVESDSTETKQGLSVAFIYGDTINAQYKFLIDAESELEREGKLIDDRIRRKYERAEKRAAELQREAPTMGQLEMQEAQIELQNLQIEIQEFQEKLARDFRKREVDLQKEYLARVNAFLKEYNDDDRFDIILNFQPGGNLLWVSESFDITKQVVKGLNEAYAEELAAERKSK
jgi:outer membrane protein